MNKKVVLITGVSSGMGKSTAIRLAKEGYTVYGTLRTMKNVPEYEKQGITILHMDITDDVSICSCVNELLAKEGRIDVLVNNAGYGSYGAIEDVAPQEAKRQFEVNVFGLARLIQLLTPTMRAQHSGTIINISSMGGRITTPMGGWYHATKYSVEALSNALRMELKPFNIQTVLIEPGTIASSWNTHAIESLLATSGSTAYHELANITANGLRRYYASSHPSSSDLIAKTISKALSKKKPKARYLVGYGAKQSIFWGKVLSARQFDWLIQKMIS